MDSTYEKIIERLYVIAYLNDLDPDELFNEFLQFIAEHIHLFGKTDVSPTASLGREENQ